MIQSYHRCMILSPPCRLWGQYLFHDILSIAFQLFIFGLISRKFCYHSKHSERFALRLSSVVCQEISKGTVYLIYEIYCSPSAVQYISRCPCLGISHFVTPEVITSCSHHAVPRFRNINPCSRPVIYGYEYRLLLSNPAIHVCGYFVPTLFPMPWDIMFCSQHVVHV